MDKKILLMILFIIVCAPSAFAENKQYHTRLLAVEEQASGLSGSIADLTLEIREGTGRVFIDTFPLTKFDTQISTRFAKEIACDYLDFECNKYDFIYTIKADSSVIGGPSAGAATTLLTIAALKDDVIPQDIAMTGTINSGGFIGPVGGLKEKIEGAKEAGITKVLIPKGKGTVKLTNDTALQCDILYCKLVEDVKEIDLVSYGKSIGVDVVEVATLDEALHEFTGADIPEVDESLLVNNKYKDVMQGLANTLCKRTNDITKDTVNTSTNISALIVSVNNLTQASKDSFANGDFYSAASFCFGANVKAREALFRSQNLESKGLLDEFNKLNNAINDFEIQVENKEIKTITDLETYMIVKERLIEAHDTLNDSIKAMKNNEDPLPSLAYGYERLASADSWSNFFGVEGKGFILDKKALEDSCKNKISEVEERLQYVALFFPNIPLQRKELDRAYEELNVKSYELCLFQASKAKAEVDVVISAYGVDVDKVNELMQAKNSITKKLIAKEVKNGIFPILGYSYYEYANVLSKTDPYSALLYYEYALELSNLDIYFTEKTKSEPLKSDYISADAVKQIIILIIGLAIGTIIGFAIKNKKKVYPQSVPKVRKRLSNKKQTKK